MDEDSLRNWGYYEPPVKGHLGLQLMSCMTDRESKFVPGRDYNPAMLAPDGTFHPRDCTVTEPPVTHMDYVRDSWINHREKFMHHMFPGNPYNSVLAEASGTSHQMILQQPNTNTTIKEEQKEEEEEEGEDDDVPAKKRVASATLRAPKGKKPRKGGSAPSVAKEKSVHRAKTAKKNVEVVINGIDMDISGIPVPVCSCTGTPQQCYRWGCGGWQSACCTTTISMYPLPMNTKRRGARIAGRKMSQGAFKKVLEKLAAEGYNFSKQIDLRTYWAKHGTNKFVIIR